MGRSTRMVSAEDFREVSQASLKLVAGWQISTIAETCDPLKLQLKSRSHWPGDDEARDLVSHASTDAILADELALTFVYTNLEYLKYYTI